MVVDEHRDLEIASLKRTGNVLEVRADFCDGRFVIRTVGDYLNRAASFVNQKVVRCPVLTKPHSFIAALREGVVMGRLCLVLGMHRTTLHVVVSF
jgi:hypothetical protein